MTLYSEDFVLINSLTLLIKQLLFRVGFTRSIKFSFRVGKDVDHVENLEFLLRIEISSQVCSTELKFGLDILSWNFYT